MYMYSIPYIVLYEVVCVYSCSVRWECCTSSTEMRLMPGRAHTALMCGRSWRLASHVCRKLLVADYNELKLQQSEGDGGGAEVAGAGDEREDPTVLKLKLT